MAKPLTTRILSLPAACIRPIALYPLAASVPRSVIHPSTSPRNRHFSRHSPSSNFALWPAKSPQKWYRGETPHSYTVEEVKQISENPEKGRIIVDLREAGEVAETGRIPGAHHLPWNSNPNALHLSPEEFFIRFGFVKPNTTPEERSKRRSAIAVSIKKLEESGKPDEVDKAKIAAENLKVLEQLDTGEEVKEVMFYCRSGVRSSQAAHLANLEVMWAANVQNGDLKGGWLEWAAQGGKAEKVEVERVGMPKDEDGKRVTLVRARKIKNEVEGARARKVKNVNWETLKKFVKASK